MDVSKIGSSETVYAGYEYGDNISDVSEEFTLGESKEKTKSVKQVLGIGFLDSGDGVTAYGMRAEYADESTDDNPIIKVTINKGGGETQEYNVEINKIKTANATELEMFALCNYMDATGQGTGGTFGSWQTLKYYRGNAVQNGIFEDTGNMEEFNSVRQNWGAMVAAIKSGYIECGLYEQALDGSKLENMLSKYE